MSRHWIIWYAVAMHALWALALLMDARAAMCTGVHSLAALFRDRWLLTLVLLAASGATIWGHFHQVSRVWLCIPQQFLLMVTALGAVGAIMRQSFADGVPRPAAFIFADQLPAVLAAVFHTLALLDMGGASWNRLVRGRSRSRL